jgi:hypothetical protein
MRIPKKVVYQDRIRNVQNFRVVAGNPQVRIRTGVGLATWVRLDRCIVDHPVFTKESEDN